MARTEWMEAVTIREGAVMELEWCWQQGLKKDRTWKHRATGYDDICHTVCRSTCWGSQRGDVLAEASLVLSDVVVPMFDGPLSEVVASEESVTRSRADRTVVGEMIWCTCFLDLGWCCW